MLFHVTFSKVYFQKVYLSSCAFIILQKCLRSGRWVFDKVAFIHRAAWVWAKNYSYSWRLNCSLVVGSSTLFTVLWKTVGLYGISTNSPFSKTSIRQVLPTAPSPMMTSFLLSVSAMMMMCSLDPLGQSEWVSLCGLIDSRYRLSTERWYAAWYAADIEIMIPPMVMFRKIMSSEMIFTLGEKANVAGAGLLFWKPNFFFL